MDTMSNYFVEETNNIQSREEDEEEEEGDKEEEKGKMNYAIKSRRSHFQTETGSMLIPQQTDLSI